MDYFKILPAEITVDIVSRLPTESVLECKLVCTDLRNLVSNHPSFSNIHLHHLNAADSSGKLGFLALTYDVKFHYFEYNNESSTTPTIQRIRRVNFTPPLKRFRFIGSCNGLICLAQDLSVCICHPITREYVVLPEICKSDSCDIKNWTINFGYVCSTNEYKVVGICRLKTHVQVHIYTLSSGRGWRDLGNFEYQFRAYNWDRPGVFVNGALYWLDDEFKTIHTFDLAEEKFGENISPPPLVQDDERVREYSIGVLDGSLYFAIRLYDERDRISLKDIWLLKKKNDDNHEMKGWEGDQSLGWSKGFTVDHSKLLAVTKSDGVLTYCDYRINIYDTKTSTSKRLVRFKNWIIQVSPHRNTFVSLKELGEEDAKVIESNEIEETKSREQLQEDDSAKHIYSW